MMNPQRNWTTPTVIITDPVERRRIALRQQKAYQKLKEAECLYDSAYQEYLRLERKYGKPTDIELPSANMLVTCISQNWRP